MKQMTEEELDEIERDMEKIEALRPGTLARLSISGELVEMTFNNILDDSRKTIGKMMAKYPNGKPFEISPWEVEILDPLSALGEVAQ